jgi:hypothetical protein
MIHFLDFNSTWGSWEKMTIFNVIPKGNYKATITSTIERIQIIQKEKKTPCIVVSVTNHDLKNSSS